MIQARDKMGFSFLFTFLGMVGIASGATWFVAENATPGGDGESWETPFDTIQAGIDAAFSGDTILIANGIYSGDGNRDLDFQGKAITVRSDSGDPTLCVIDCEGSSDEPHRGFRFSNGEGEDSIVEGLSISNGYAPQENYDYKGTRYYAAYGGGILCIQSSPSFINCIIKNNYARNGGGGVYFRVDCNSTFTGCTVDSNSSIYGGGVFCYECSPTLNNCNITGNSASTSGGGVFCRDESPTMIDCTICENSATTYGGGVYVMDYPALTDCTINGNTAKSGGGLYCTEDSSPTLTDCIISDNSVRSFGGGIYCDVSSTTLTACQIIGNSADLSGGGILFKSYGASTLTDCTISENTAKFNGAGVLCSFSSPAFTNCALTNNRTDEEDGGGIVCEHYSCPSLTDCSITGNSANEGGGGLYCTGSSDPQLTNCELTLNSAKTGGGGVYTSGSSPVFLNCIISGNAAINSSSGGGLFCSSGNPIVLNCAIADNSAENNGGGVFTSNSDPNLANCVLLNNQAFGEGGGLYCQYLSDLTITNCTIIGNTAAQGVGLTCDSYNQLSPSTVTIANSVLWNGPDEIRNNDASTLTITYSDIQCGTGQTWFGTGCIDVYPMFVDSDGPDDDPLTWNDNNYRLAAGSPCIDAGNNLAVPSDEYDLDGDGDTLEPLPVDGEWRPRHWNDPMTVDTGNPGFEMPMIDMGAFEYHIEGDLDGNAQIDLDDLSLMVNCIEGPEVQSTIPCRIADLDRDDDIDLFDFSVFQQVFTNP